MEWKVGRVGVEWELYVEQGCRQWGLSVECVNCIYKAMDF